MVDFVLNFGIFWVQTIKQLHSHIIGLPTLPQPSAIFQASYAFADIFVTVWVGSGVVTLNAVLLRGKAGESNQKKLLKPQTDEYIKTLMYGIGI